MAWLKNESLNLTVVMKEKPRKFRPQFKANIAIEAVKGSYTLSQLAKKFNVDLQQKSGHLDKSHTADFWLYISFSNSSIVLLFSVECILLLLYQVSIHCNIDSSASELKL